MTSEPALFHDFLRIFVPLFVVIDPAGTLPLFLALTQNYSESGRRVIARRATVVAGITGIVILVVGQAIFEFVGVQFADFQIAGGVLLVVLSIIDMLSSGKPAVDEAQLARTSSQVPPAEVGVVPLAVPLIMGPATMTITLLLVSTYSGPYAARYGPTLGPAMVVGMVALAMLLNLYLLYGIMCHTALILKVVGRQAMVVANKVVMILLAAIAVSLIRQGIVTVIRGLGGR